MATLKLFLAGDVMTGRGIDQILPHPGDPTLHERYMHDARDYVRLAERRCGQIPRPVAPGYIWGDALEVLANQRPDLRIINLETAVTASDAAWPDKGVHYRMHPDNIGCLSAAGIDCAVLANNHVLDWGRPGLTETLSTLHNAGITSAGAGADGDAADEPACLGVSGGVVLVFAYAMDNAGTPAQWLAGRGRPGINWLPDYSDTSFERIAAPVRACRARPHAGAVLAIVVSIHWGSNWGYALEPGQREFAHRLIDEAGVDIVHGHSSHHVKGIECHAGKLVLYGCGDLINDYEGIGGYDTFAPDLGLLYFPTIEPGTGRLQNLMLWPVRRRALRLCAASDEDVAWLHSALNREGRPLGTRVDCLAGGWLRVRASDLPPDSPPDSRRTR
jgi:poly-gamma-glutamate synthesis protein (capsule biosynthesis protein)